MASIFDPKSPSDIATLIAQYPLAWLISGQFNAAPLPLLAETDETGQINSLLGHCGRRNLLVADLQRDARALILFQGPSGYISPQLLDDRNWGPTWNYASVQFLVDVTFVEDETRQAVEKLVAHCESGADAAWNVGELGARYHDMLGHIIAFRAKVISQKAVFKLGQDEKPAALAQIIHGLPDRTLADWMEDQNSLMR